MDYHHIDNLYKNRDILMFRECWALEKIHGTSAGLSYKDGALRFHADGEDHQPFVALFDPELAARIAALGHPEVRVYGEHYGGRIQRQSVRYGKERRFIAFEVKIGETWLSVPDAAAVVVSLGLEFVHFEQVSTDPAALDAARDAPSVQAQRNGCGIHPREGVVLRPLLELTKNNGARIIAKHKPERETKTPRRLDDAALQVLSDASEIADEWVTMERLAHVIQHLEKPALAMTDTAAVCRAMLEDVLREGLGEIVDSKEARRAIGKRAAGLFRQWLNNQER